MILYEGKFDRSFWSCLGHPVCGGTRVYMGSQSLCGGARDYVVAHEILESAQGPLVLGLRLKGLGPGFDNSGPKSSKHQSLIQSGKIRICTKILCATTRPGKCQKCKSLKLKLN